MRAAREPLAALAAIDAFPVLSVFVPVDPTEPDLTQVRIALKDAERTAGTHATALGVGTRARQPLLAALASAVDAPGLGPAARTLAVIAAPSGSWARYLTRPVEPLTVLGRTPVLTPLIEELRPHDRFHVLAISQHRVRLLAVDGPIPAEVHVPGMPASREEALRLDTHERGRHIHGGHGRGSGGMVHGYETETDERKSELLRYFQAVSNALDGVPTVREVPLVLACVAYEAPIYRAADPSPTVVTDTVAGNPELLDDATLSQRARAAVAPVLAGRDRVWAANAADRLGTGLADSDLPTVLAAAAAGRVAALFVRPEARAWGAVTGPSGTVERHDMPMAGDDDLLSRAIADVIRAGGRILAIHDDAPLAAYDVVALHRF